MISVFSRVREAVFVAGWSAVACRTDERQRDTTNDFLSVSRGYSQVCASTQMCKTTLVGHIMEPVVA